jgi:hypothetical protein
MTIPVDGYSPQTVAYQIGTESPSSAFFTMEFSLFGGEGSPERETLVDALDAGVAAIVSHLQTEEPTWNAALATKSFHGMIQVFPTP